MINWVKDTNKSNANIQPPSLINSNIPIPNLHNTSKLDSSNLFMPDIPPLKANPQENTKLLIPFGWTFRNYLILFYNNSYQKIVKVELS